MRNKTMTIHEFMEIQRGKESDSINLKQFYIIAILIILSSLLITLDTDNTITAFQSISNLSSF